MSDYRLLVIGARFLAQPVHSAFQTRCPFNLVEAGADHCAGRLPKTSTSTPSSCVVLATPPAETLSVPR
jgi:hypothetical protein